MPSKKKPLTIQKMNEKYPMLLWCPICKETTPHKRIYRHHSRQSNITDKVECQRCGLRTTFITMSNWKGNPLQKSENVMKLIAYLTY